MTMLWGTAATYGIFGEAELFWCVECDNDEIFDRPGGQESAEAFCVSCGTAVFLWVGTLELQPAASSTTPMSAVATPAA